MEKFVVYLYNARILQTVTNQHSLTKRLAVDRNATASRGQLVTAVLWYGSDSVAQFLVCVNLAGYYD